MMWPTNWFRPVRSGCSARRPGLDRGERRSQRRARCGSSGTTGTYRRPRRRWCRRSGRSVTAMLDRAGSSHGLDRPEHAHSAAERHVRVTRRTGHRARVTSLRWNVDVRPGDARHVPVATATEGLVTSCGAIVAVPCCFVVNTYRRIDSLNDIPAGSEVHARSRSYLDRPAQERVPVGVGRGPPRSRRVDAGLDPVDAEQARR